jgi:hypothetical protein
MGKCLAGSCRVGVVAAAWAGQPACGERRPRVLAVAVGVVSVDDDPAGRAGRAARGSGACPGDVPNRIDDRPVDPAARSRADRNNLPRATGGAVGAGGLEGVGLQLAMRTEAIAARARRSRRGRPAETSSGDQEQSHGRDTRARISAETRWVDEADPCSQRPRAVRRGGHASTGSDW